MNHRIAVCGHQDSGCLDTGIIDALALNFPAGHYDPGCLALYASAVRRKNQAVFAMLPFCCTIEAESLGADIQLGNANIGPRPGAAVYTSLEALIAEDPQIDFHTGRIGALLTACRKLHQAGEKTVVEISGPLSILSALIGLPLVIKSWRKNEALLQQVFRKIGAEQIIFAQMLRQAGVDLISFADPIGWPHIIGPNFSELLVKSFLLSFLSDMQCALNGASFHVCPSHARLLVNTGRARWEKIQLDAPLLYQQACLDLSEQGLIFGQGCIKRQNYRLRTGVIKQLCLSQSNPSH